MTTRRVPTIAVSGDLLNGNVYLTAGIQPPADEGTPFDQVQVHSEMQSYASGGSIYHMNLTERMNNIKKCSFVKSLFNNFPLRYISLTPILSICQACGSKSVGKITTCPNCSSEDITAWSRPVGYFRPAARGHLSEDLRRYDYRFWLNGRFEEFLRRRTFREDDVNDLLKQKHEIMS